MPYGGWQVVADQKLKFGHEVVIIAKENYSSTKEVFSEHLRSLKVFFRINLVKLVS